MHCFTALEYGVLMIGYLVGMFAVLAWVVVIFVERKG